MAVTVAIADTLHFVQEKAGIELLDALLETNAKFGLLTVTHGDAWLRLLEEQRMQQYIPFHAFCYVTQTVDHIDVGSSSSDGEL